MKDRLKITPEMVQLFRRAAEILKTGAVEQWEAARREYLNKFRDLHFLLGRKLFELDVCDCDTEEAPQWIIDEGRAAEWAKARAVRAQLEAAAK